MKKRIIIYFAFVLILSISFSSALMFDDFWSRIKSFSITGKAVQESGWTNWYNRDRPGGTGDYETLNELRRQYGFCESPSRIECQTTKGINYSKTGEIVICERDKGAICKRKEQPDKKCNYDYKVRFFCGEIKQEMQCTDSDGGLNYSAKGITQGIFKGNKATKKDLCRNSKKVREFYCKSNAVYVKDAVCPTGMSCAKGACNKKKKTNPDLSIFCVNKNGWTKWLDMDNPNGTGDWETLNNFKRICPDICDSPSKIQCKTISNKKYSKTKDNLTCERDKGLICKNNEQEDSRCDEDYKVRFYCSKKRENFACSDGDGGINYNIKGTVNLYSNNKKTTSKTDLCISNKILSELYCPFGKIEYYNYTCPNKCINGACT